MNKLILAGLAFAMWGTAWAGDKFSLPVFVDKAHSEAGGSIASARNDAGYTEMLYCDSNWYSDGSQSAQCVAVDASGNLASCYTTNASLAATARTLNGDSTIGFLWDSKGNCTTIEVTNGSMYEPKQP
jgi:hypothetical protein